MIRSVALFILFLSLISCVTGKKGEKIGERFYQENWCKKRGGKMEVVMPDGTRCDCLTKTYAVEFDFAGKWAEAIGQSLNYARQTGRKPGIVIICRRKKDKKKLKIIRSVARFYKLPITVWELNCL